MPLDPVRAADARAWLEKATLDLRSAEADLAARPAIIGDALFHCQQGVEKALKGLLAWHDERGGTATRERRASRCAPRRTPRWRWHGRWWRLRCNGCRHPPVRPDKQIAAFVTVCPALT